ncbi:hypothetical protein WJX72_003104 [[Myrmecia] bisecta]|uniref:Uncharacterized protein n=1 Tax=[Myrmecia] bisecta TaxID=41462 RepID=A0AAW1PXY3_9CHLO
MLDMQMRHLYLFTEEQLQLQDRLWRAVQKHAAASPASLVLPPSLALDHMVRLLLTPRQLSRPALHAALNQLGLQVALEDVQTRDLDALHSYVVQVLNTRGPNVPELASGQLLLNTYWEQWRALHPASALLRHPSTGAAAVLRGGCAVSLLRDGSPEEVLQAGAGLPRQAGGADVAQLQVCMDALRRSLGSINVELFAALFRMGADASKELDALLALVRMTGSLADNPGLLFFKGYSTLHLLKRTQEPASRRRILAEAARPLFRAAACLLPQNASQPPSNGSSRQLLRQLLQQVLTDTTGSYTDEGPQAVVLQYYELLMMVCERLGSPEGAAAFAQAAVQQVDVAYPNDKDEEARARREGRLWANLFVYALDAGAFEEAYAALQANPLPERKLDCLQRLVVTLCARGEIQTLCRLPYSGNCKKQQNGSTTLVSLLEEAQHVLQRRAEHAEVAARPQPYQVLYDFHTARSNYKSAALAQLSLARRLRDEAADAPGVLPQIERALGAAVNALSLVEPAAAWLEDPFPAGPAPEALLRKGGRGTPGSSRYLTDVTNGATAKQSSRSILSLADLQKEHAVAHAHVLVAKQLPTADLGHSSRDDIFQHLLSAGLFDAAVSMATAVFEGAALTRALERALASMAAACVRLQLREEMPQAAAMSSGRGASSWLEGDAQSTVSAAALWSQLRRCLWQYDNARHAFRLRLAVLDAVLANERRLKLPAWLLALFEVREDAAKAAGMSGNGADPAALLRAYLKYGRLEDAASLALRHLQAWDDEVMDIYRQRSCISWFPYGLLETLIARLAAAQSEPLRALQRQLSDAVERHKQAALRQSAILEERLQLRR